ncbi:MAG: hypothetical protein IPL78_29925 [Chloroflexi bacterium]|nr:hypothetical protein [Chloroflexota bacterium]
MKLFERSYPHPVVGNRDDVPNAAFQATIEMSSDKQFIYLDFTDTTFRLNIPSENLNDSIEINVFAVATRRIHHIKFLNLIPTMETQFLKSMKGIF